MLQAPAKRDRAIHVVWSKPACERSAPGQARRHLFRPVPRIRLGGRGQVSEVRTCFTHHFIFHRQAPVSLRNSDMIIGARPAMPRPRQRLSCRAGAWPHPPFRPGLRKSRGAADGGVILPSDSFGPSIGASEALIQAGSADHTQNDEIAAGKG